MTATLAPAAVWDDTEQPLLDMEELTTPVYAKDATIQERFEAFHEANPWVYRALVSLTRDWIGKGHDRIGIKMLTEIIRWHYGRQTTDSTGFRLNNNYPSRYVRLIITEHPEWAPVFETRELRSA
jgi:hypothetical protein